MNKPIIFYNKECGFCNRTVTWILKEDTEAKLMFCSLASETAQPILSHYGVTITHDTVYYLEEERVYSKSTAWSKIMKTLYPSKTILINLVCLIPRAARDLGYNWIAKHRKSFFPNNDYGLMKAEWKERFLGT